MAMTSTLLVPGGWQILSGVNPYLAPINRAPPIIWVGLTLLLLVVAVAHAKARMRLEQARFSEEHGWHFSEEWSPIQDSDWQQLSLNLGLGALSSTGHAATMFGETTAESRLYCSTLPDEEFRQMNVAPKA
jgi:hypothetical protein